MPSDDGAYQKVIAMLKAVGGCRCQSQDGHIQERTGDEWGSEIASNAAAYSLRGTCSAPPAAGLSLFTRFQQNRRQPQLAENAERCLLQAMYSA